MYCVVLHRNDKMLDRQLFESAVDALNNMLIMIAAAALSCDDIPNISVELFECETPEKEK